jgi:protein-L-isoaspartate(D-aspartate) O-methyltransferase
VMTAMLQVPRHLFVPDVLAHLAYQDMPLPIGFEKTISQPFITALMTDLLAPERHEGVLEIGTGLGYQAAILAELAGRVRTVEVVEEFATEAELRLNELGYNRVGIRIGDGSRGWGEHAPYDKILVTAAAEQPPPALLEQLRPGGRMVLPMGLGDAQQLTVVQKNAEGRFSFREVLPVRFSRLEAVL